MPTFNVQWDEDIEADTALEAAQKARALMAGPIGDTHIFVVWAALGDGRVVDLREDTTSDPIISPHRHQFTGDENTCTVYRDCPVTWGEFLSHERKQKES